MDLSDVDVQVLQNGPLLTDARRELLSLDVTEEEVRCIIFSIPNTRSPGPDGFSSGFYKAAWAIVGKDLAKAVQDLFRSGKLLQDANSTNITLVPKVPNPEFGPIARCNIVY